MATILGDIPEAFEVPQPLWEEGAPPQPVLFLAHGSPMNALADNAFTRALARLGGTVRPERILCISAHWLTQGSHVTAMRHPSTIHDFFGFPPELHQIRYPAPGSPELAGRVRALIPHAHADLSEWGLDHGTWSVLMHLYPEADIPVVQLSLDLNQPPAHHFDLGAALRPLRDEGVLIVASGNIVHHLGLLRPDPEAAAYDWAVTFDAWVQQRVIERDTAALVNDYPATRAGALSVPTADHYLPLLYALGATDAEDAPRVVHEGFQHGSISMRCLIWERAG